MTAIPDRKEPGRPEDLPSREDAEAGGPGGDDVEEGSMESFPASDPPAWMSPTTTVGPPRRR